MLTSVVLSFFQEDNTKKEDVVDSSYMTISTTPFQLPITYQETRVLNPVISQDLELVKEASSTPMETVLSKSTKTELVKYPIDSRDISGESVAPSAPSMYERLFEPTHQFAKDIIPRWATQFTTETTHLRETQEVIREMPKYKAQTKIDSPYCFGLQDEHCTRLRAVLDSLNNPAFLEKYNYMEWSFLKPLNESALFLELLAIGNVLSPIASLLLPVVFLFIPFVILKLQGVPLTLEVYVDVLKQVARNHFIGKALLMGMDSFTMDKVLYLIFMFGLYLMQIYQNVMAVKRMYENVGKMNQDLVDLRDFCQYTTKNMRVFCEMHHQSKSTYKTFCDDIQARYTTLVDLRDRLATITPFSLNFAKFQDLGTMLEIYYKIHSNEVYQEALRYAFGFEGYMDNLCGVHRHWELARISMMGFPAATSGRSRPKFIDQYHPALLDQESRIRNTVNLKRNWLITGPNASGKTTLLKSTAINVILTQQLGCGFYGEGSTMPRTYSHIHSYLNIPDTSERDSLFQAEARRCKVIIDAVEAAPAAERHFCIFDELYSGTNPKEASKAAYAFLKFLSARKNVDYILTTHYVDVCKRLVGDKARITNQKMLIKKDPDTGAMKYTYRVKRGVSTVLGAGQILKDMNYPVEIMGDFHQEDGQPA